MMMVDDVPIEFNPEAWNIVSRVCFIKRNKKKWEKKRIRATRTESTINLPAPFTVLTQNGLAHVFLVSSVHIHPLIRSLPLSVWCYCHWCCEKLDFLHISALFTSCNWHRHRIVRVGDNKQQRQQQQHWRIVSYARIRIIYRTNPQTRIRRITLLPRHHRPYLQSLSSGKGRVLNSGVS